MRLPKYLLAALLAAGTCSGAWAQGTGCNVYPRDLSISYAGHTGHTVPDPEGTPGFEASGQKYFDVVAGKVTSSATVNLDKVKPESLKPSECILDLLALMTIAGRDAKPALMQPVLSPELAEIVAKNSTPEMDRKIKESMEGVSELKLLLALNVEGQVLCYYSLKFPTEENVFPALVVKTDAGYRALPVKLGKDNPKFTNLYNALYAVVVGKTAALTIKEN